MLMPPKDPFPKLTAVWQLQLGYPQLAGRGENPSLNCIIEGEE